MSFDETCPCPLCGEPVPPASIVVSGVRYRHCGRCDMVFREPAQRLDRAAELAHYGTHENDVHDPRYRRFLSQLAEPLGRLLHPGSRGLDYGAGPAPALAAMLEEAGHAMRVYDPFFAPDASVLERAYDFITATEVVEHMHHPGRELARFDAMLEPGGLLGLMTELRPEVADFAGWYYPRDPTHVSFYSADSIRFIAQRHGFTIEHLGARVVILRKPSTPARPMAGCCPLAGAP